VLEDAALSVEITLSHLYPGDRSVPRNTGGRILGRNWDKSLKSFPPCYSQLPLLTDFTSPHSKSGLKLVCKVNIVYGNLKSENFQDYA
jgi:hypothetical protein